MSEAPPAAAPRPPWRDNLILLCAAISSAFVIGGALRYDGGRDQLISANAREIIESEIRTNLRIDKIERRTDKLEEIDRRLARIEGKLDAGALTRGANP